ncbi:MAG: diguanylate cyclase, partial [Schwartzia sp.]|nr:diguanylate cyclase [Schwartzia sp. (in: firmicutes)]
PATGDLTGALKDYLAVASGYLKNAHLDFEAKAFPTTASALEALKRGEVDCVFPANLGSFDGETMRIFMTPPLMRSEIYAVVRQTDQNIFAKRDHVIVAVNEGNPNYEVCLLENFPGWRKVYYANTADCLEAVSKGVADCVLISSYRYNNISRLCERYHLTTFATGVGLDYGFAIKEGDTELYSIMAKVVGLVPNATVNAALSRYITEDAKLTLYDVIVDNLSLVMAAIGVVVLIILLLLAWSLWTKKKARKLIAATEIDKLTGLYNREFFFQYANRMYRKQPKKPMDAIVLNIEQFHSVNALNGRDYGNHVLRVLGNEVHDIANEAGGIAGRFGADRFDIYCRHMEDYRGIFERLQDKLDALASNASIRLRMGVMPWQENLEPVQLFDRARTACSMAKGNFKDHLIVFDEKVRERELLDQRLLNDLRRALDNFEFEV